MAITAEITADMLYTTTEAARLLGLTQGRMRHFYRAHQTGGKKFGKKIGRDIVFTGQDLRRIADAGYGKPCGIS